MKIFNSLSKISSLFGVIALLAAGSGTASAQVSVNRGPNPGSYSCYVSFTSNYKDNVNQFRSNLKAEGFTNGIYSHERIPNYGGKITLSAAKSAQDTTKARLIDLCRIHLKSKLKDACSPSINDLLGDSAPVTKLSGTVRINGQNLTGVHVTGGTYYLKFASKYKNLITCPSADELDVWADSFVEGYMGDEDVQ